ncbi:MAG: hypothetical protein ABJB78_09700 [Betaproteobacteria bacterium]
MTTPTVWLFLAFLLAGCAAAPAVVATPDGTLVAKRKAGYLTEPTGPLRLQAMKDATDYCAARNTRVKVIRSREIPAIGHWPEAEISFTCE